MCTRTRRRLVVTCACTLLALLSPEPADAASSHLTGGVAPPASGAPAPVATPVVNPSRTGGIAAPPDGTQVPSPGKAPNVPQTPPSAPTGAPSAPSGPPANRDIPA